MIRRGPASRESSTWSVTQTAAMVNLILWLSAADGFTSIWSHFTFQQLRSTKKRWEITRFPRQLGRLQRMKKYWAHIVSMMFITRIHVVYNKLTPSYAIESRIYSITYTRIKVEKRFPSYSAISFCIYLLPISFFFLHMFVGVHIVAWCVG